MTRINASIPPAKLTTKHLIAEHREIKRIPNCIKKGRYNLSGIPDKFTLGTGHVKFFYNKLLYLYNRYKSLYQECKNRNLNVTDYSESFENVKYEAIEKSLWNDWVETEESKMIIT